MDTLDVEFDRFIERQMGMPEIPGIVIGFIQHSTGRKLCKTYGRQKREISSKTRFPICSLTKLFTAMTLLKVLEENGMSPDTPINAVLPSFRLANDASVTFKHALSHTTGLETSDVMYTDPAAQADMIGYLWTLPCSAPPGQVCSYSNYMYDILATAIEALSGRSFADFLKENVFEPLGMSDTSFHGVAGDDMATGLTPRLKEGRLIAGQAIVMGCSPEMGIQRLIHRGSHMGTGSYGIISTAEDMLKWLQSLPSNPHYHIVCQAITGIADPWHPGGSLLDHPPTYGMGLFQGSHQGVNLVEAYGATAGYRTNMAHIPGLDCSVVCLANSEEAHELLAIVKIWMIRRTLGLDIGEAIFKEREERYAMETANLPPVQGLDPLPSDLPFGTYLGPGLGEWVLTAATFRSVRPECVNSPYLPWLYGQCLPLLTPLGDGRYAGCMRWTSDLTGEEHYGCPFECVQRNGGLEITGPDWGEEGELCVLRKT